MLHRRALLILPAALGACGSTPPPQLEGPPISYAHLTQIRLDVSAIATEDRSPNAGPNDFGRTLQPTAVEAVLIMGRDRLAAFGSGNRARFSVTRAQVLRASPRGGSTEQLTCSLTARLEILGENDRRLGYAEASAERSRTAESVPSARGIVAESLLRQTMFDLNTEFEFQIRRALRPYLVEGTGAAPPPPVAREAL